MLALIDPFVARDRTVVKFSTAIKLFHVPAAKNSFFTQILTQFFLCVLLPSVFFGPPDEDDDSPRPLSSEELFKFFCSAFK